jgi:hypothetical protein
MITETETLYKVMVVETRVYEFTVGGSDEKDAELHASEALGNLYCGKPLGQGLPTDYINCQEIDRQTTVLDGVKVDN